MTASAEELRKETKRNPFLLDGDGEYYYTMATLRDLFAAFSMLAHRAGEWDNTPSGIAHRAYADADAMLKERAK